MVTEQIDVEYLISTPVNYTFTNLAEHLENTSHDAINDYLNRERHSARCLWELSEPLIENKEEAYFIIEDSVLEKPDAEKIELVKRQWNGNAHAVVKGIRIVNLVYSDKEEAFPIDF